MQEIQLRKFPYPYRAAFSIANDIDWMSWDSFKEIYGYLCSDKETSLGKGLQLPLSSSFFLFNDSGSDEFSYFATLGCKNSVFCQEMESLIHAGYLDAFHGFGRFASETAFKREYAQAALQIFKERNLNISTYSTHGYGYNIEQIDPSGIGKHAQGDQPNTLAYHMDITRAYGVEFAWTWSNGGITNIIGQDSESFLSFAEDLYIPLAKNGVKEYEKVDVSSTNIVNEKNSLLVPSTMKDGTRVYNFRRFNGGIDIPTATNFAKHINPLFMNELICNSSYMILYQHLGSKQGENGRSIPNTPPYFDDESKKNLEFIAKLFREGFLLILPLAALLNYNYVTTHLMWSYVKVGKEFRIKIHCIQDDFFETNLLKIPMISLQGLTFYTPDPSNTHVYVGDNLVQGLLLNPPDFTGKHSVSIPLQRIQKFDIN